MKPKVAKEQVQPVYPDSQRGRAGRICGGIMMEASELTRLLVERGAHDADILRRVMSITSSAYALYHVQDREIRLLRESLETETATATETETPR